MITSLPSKKNLLSRIFERTRLKPGTPDRVREAVGGDRCLLTRGARVTELPLFNLFFVGERKAADVLLVVASMIQELLHKVWISDRTLYEYSRVWILRTFSDFLVRRFSPFRSSTTVNSPRTGGGSWKGRKY